MTARPITAKPAPTCLTFGGYRECAGCSKGVHLDHVPVNCDCGLCAEEAS